MVDYSASIKKPFLDVKNLLIGILLGILPIVRWFAFGYALESSGLTKKKVPLGKSAEWSDWANLFFKGFQGTVISIIYFLPAIIIFLVGALSALAAIISVVGWSVLISGDSMAISQTVAQNSDKIIPLLVGALPFIFISVLLCLLAYYVLPSALMNFLYHNRFGKAFSLGTVFSKAFTGVYFVAWLVALVITLVIGLVLGWIPWVGGGAAFFLSSVITYTIFGQVYKEVKN